MTIQGKRILITGGAGFIGSHLALTLAKHNTVTVYDNITSSVISKKEMLQTSPAIEFIEGDILDAPKLKRAMKNIDIVFHCAVACVRLSLSDPKLVHEVNATGTLTTLLEARDAHVQRFIYISSSEVYGSATARSISETHPIDPTTVYGMSKYIGENYTRYFHAHEGVTSVIVRPFNSYGPRCHFDGVYGEVIPRFVVRALAGKPPIIFGDGTQTRDFTYITDTVQGIIMAASTAPFPKKECEVFNIARGKEVSITTLAATILASIPSAHNQQSVYKKTRPNDVLRHAANITKAKRMLGFRPAVKLTEGIRHYISWLQAAHPDATELEKRIPEMNW